MPFFMGVAVPAAAKVVTGEDYRRPASYIYPLEFRDVPVISRVLLISYFGQRDSTSNKSGGRCQAGEAACREISEISRA